MTYLTSKGKDLNRYLNKLVRFKPTGHETDILYELFKKYDIQDVLLIIQEYVNRYNKELYCVLMSDTISLYRTMHVNHNEIKLEIRNILMHFRMFTAIHNEKKSVKKDLQLLKSNGMYRNQLEDLEKQKNELIDTIYESLTPSIVSEIIEILRKVYPLKHYQYVHSYLNSLLDY